MSTRTAPAKAVAPSKSKVAPKAAERAVAAAEAIEPIDWGAVEDAYLAAEEASETASKLEATGDDAVFEANKPIHEAWRTARHRLMDTPAPHWAALALKASVFLRMWDDNGAADTRWLKAAKDFSDAALKIGTADLAEANPVDVMSARGHAEQLCYYLANDEDGYRAWAVSLGGVGQLASEAEGIASESRSLAHATAAQRNLSAEVISAVWFGQSALLDAQEPPAPPPPSWDALLRAYEAAKAEATARGQEHDAAYDSPTSSVEEKDRANSRYEAAQRLADTALEAIIDFPVTTAEQLAIKHQLAADRWLLRNEGETLSSPDFVEAIASQSEATRWIMGRLHQDLLRLAGKDGECEVAQQANRFADAVVRHSELDGKRGAVVEAECDAQWHLMVAAEEAAQAGQPTSRAGVAFQLLCAVGEIEAVENGRDEQVKLQAGEKIRTAVTNAITALGLPCDLRTAEYFLGERLTKRLAA